MRMQTQPRLTEGSPHVTLSVATGVQTVGDALVDSIISDNIPILGEEAKFNETVTSSLKRVEVLLPPALSRLLPALLAVGFWVGESSMPSCYIPWTVRGTSCGLLLEAKGVKGTQA